MRITHEIYKTDLKCDLDLNVIAKESLDAVYKQSPFKLLQWRHREIGGCAFVYHSGKIICHGNEKQIRKYYRLIKRLGFPVKFDGAQVVTKSAVHTLSNPVNYISLCASLPNVSYEPELFNAPILKRGKISFTVYHTGKVIITGVKTDDDIEDIVMPTLLEIDICSTYSREDSAT